MSGLPSAGDTRGQEGGCELTSGRPSASGETTWNEHVVVQTQRPPQAESLPKPHVCWTGCFQDGSYQPEAPRLLFKPPSLDPDAHLPLERGLW